MRKENVLLRRTCGCFMLHGWACSLCLRAPRNEWSARFNGERNQRNVVHLSMLQCIKSLFRRFWSCACSADNVRYSVTTLLGIGVLCPWHYSVSLYVSVIFHFMISTAQTRRCHTVICGARHMLRRLAGLPPWPINTVDSRNTAQPSNSFVSPWR